MNSILSTVAGMFCPAWVNRGITTSQGFLEGNKVYLIGLIAVLQALVALITEFCGLKGTSEVINWIFGLATNNSAIEMLVALGAIHHRWATEKLHMAVESSVVASGAQAAVINVEAANTK